MTDNGLSNTAPTVVALVPDLLAAARIRGAMAGARTARTVARLGELVGPATRLVLVDLQASGAAEAIRLLRASADPPRIVAYGPHVEGAALRAARQAGADRVLTRGAFVRELPAIIEEFIG